MMKQFFDFYRDKHVMVTGGGGFVGGHVVKSLCDAGARVHVAGRRQRPDHLPETVTYVQADLTERKACLEALSGMQLVFHLAAAGGGFHANLTRQAKILTENLMLNTSVMDCAAAVGVERYLYTSSMAVYPQGLTDPDETDSLQGDPYPGEHYYGWAKRMGEIQARAYYEQFQIPVAIVRPSNPYGPGDNFDPAQCHVIPAMIGRALSGENPFTVWGTGKPQRDFIHAADAARGMLLALEKHAVCEPINLGTGSGTSIAELAQTVLKAAGKKDVAVIFDTDKPDGPQRRVPKAQRLRDVLGLNHLMPLEQGIEQTIAWFKKNRNNVS